jgi:hypothetical protein
MTRGERLVLFALLAIGLSARVAVVLHAGPMTDQNFFGDDSFIYHELAMEIVRGRGITQAGLPTNGFQPLFVALLVPIAWLFDIHAATIASSLVCGVLSMAGGFVLFAIVRRLTTVRTGLIALGLWTASEYLLRVALNGMETALANLLMLVLIAVHLRSVEPDRRFSAGRGAGLGVIAGLAVLSRFDLGLLVVLIGLQQIWVRVRRSEWKTLLATTVAGAAVVAPWFIWSYAIFGRLTPVSGAGQRTVSQLFGNAGGPLAEPVYFELGHPPWSFYADNLVAAASTVLCDSPLALPVAAFGRSAVAAGVWLAACLCLAAWFGRSREGAPAEARSWSQVTTGVIRRTWFLWAFVPLLVGAYCFYFFAQWHFWRYMAPVVIAVIVPSAVCVDQLWSAAARWSPAAGRAAWVATVVVFFAAGARTHAKFVGPVEKGIAYRIYHDAIDIREWAKPGMRLGSFESGTLDYFLDPDVLVFNLDGKTNPAAQRAMAAGTMDELIEALRLDYVVSSPPPIRDQLFRRGRFDANQLELVGRMRHNLVFKVHPRTTGDGA